MAFFYVRLILRTESITMRFLFICGLFLCHACTSSTALTVDQRTELKNFFARSHSDRLLYLEKEDIEHSISCYAEDAYLFDIGSTIKGRDQIKKHLSIVLNSMELRRTKNVQLECEISGDLAYDYGYTTMDLYYTFTGLTEQVKSKYIAVWRRQDSGDWKIIKLIFNQDG